MKTLRNELVVDNCVPGFQEVSLGRAKSLQERQSVWQKDKGMLIHYKAVLLLHKHIFMQVVTYFECLEDVDDIIGSEEFCQA